MIKIGTVNKSICYQILVPYKIACSTIGEVGSARALHSEYKSYQIFSRVKDSDIVVLSFILFLFEVPTEIVSLHIQRFILRCCLEPQSLCYVTSFLNIPDEIPSAVRRYGNHFLASLLCIPKYNFYENISKGCYAPQMRQGLD